MPETTIEACVPVDISDDDIFEAMRDIPGYLDITPEISKRYISMPISMPLRGWLARLRSQVS